MGAVDFYIDYELEAEHFSDDMRAEVESRLRKLASEDTDMVGAAVSVTQPGINQKERPIEYQVRVVVYARPEDVVAIKKDDTIQGAMKAALSAIERQIRDKREKLGEPWKRNDLPGNPA